MSHCHRFPTPPSRDGRPDRHIPVGTAAPCTARERAQQPKSVLSRGHRGNPMGGTSWSHSWGSDREMPGELWKSLSSSSCSSWNACECSGSQLPPHPLLPPLQQPGKTERRQGVSRTDPRVQGNLSLSSEARATWSVCCSTSTNLHIRLPGCPSQEWKCLSGLQKGTSLLSRRGLREE